MRERYGDRDGERGIEGEGEGERVRGRRRAEEGEN